MEVAQPGSQTENASAKPYPHAMRRSLGFPSPPFAPKFRRYVWALLDGDDIAADVQTLRQELDQRQPFDRKTAYALYQALLSDKAIQAVIADKPVLVIVPSGSLTSLPPSLLVTAPPQGDDSSPADLRATHWLIKDKAIAILPSVSSLRALRQLYPRRKAGNEPLLEFADPDFAGTLPPLRLI